MTRALEAYAIAIAITVFGVAVGMAIFHGQPFLVAMLGDQVGTVWTGALAIGALALFAIIPAAASRVLVRQAPGASRVVRGAIGAVCWAGSFLVVGLAILCRGVADERLDWNGGSTAFDLVVVAIAGIAFVEWLPSAGSATVAVPEVPEVGS